MNYKKICLCVQFSWSTTLPLARCCFATTMERPVHSFGAPFLPIFDCAEDPCFQALCFACLPPALWMRRTRQPAPSAPPKQRASPHWQLSPDEFLPAKRNETFEHTWKTSFFEQKQTYAVAYTAKACKAAMSACSASEEVA